MISRTISTKLVQETQWLINGLRISTSRLKIPLQNLNRALDKVT